MTSAQEKTSRKLAQKISKSSHQFKKKGNEVQYSFNLAIEDSISAAKVELEKIKPSDASKTEAMKKVHNLLDEGIKALERRQKHILVAGQQSSIMITIHWRQILTKKSGLKRLRRRLNEHPLKDAEVVASVERGGGAGPGTKRGPTFTQPSAPAPLMP